MYYPGSERMTDCARTFQELADLYYKMPCRKETFSRQDIEEIFEEAAGSVCRGCARFEECWKEQGALTYQRLYGYLESLEGADETRERDKIGEFCVVPEILAEKMKDIFGKMKMKLYFSNQLLESREAVADQFWEMSRLLDEMVDEVLRTGEMKEPINRRICRRFSRRGVAVSRIFAVQRTRRCQEIYIAMRARRGCYVSAKELGEMLSGILHRKIVPAGDSRAMIGTEEDTVLFLEDTKYSLLYGISRVPKAGELLSGDSFSHIRSSRGEAVLSLSDGMGSGESAKRESEHLIELLEQFLEAGMSRDTAMKMINSAAVFESRSYSTLDVCAVDLYSGNCELHKCGAAPTFVLHGGEVDVIRCAQGPMGVFHHIETQGYTCRLADGDYVVMVTDGALEALPGEKKEEAFGSLIKSLECGSPKEMARQIMDRLLGECGGEAKDDMTVFVAGIWQK